MGVGASEAVEAGKAPAVIQVISGGRDGGGGAGTTTCTSFDSRSEVPVSSNPGDRC